ncbi:MAG: hypothetical protein L3V56_10100, partial [Candidatus Magnetoovum sp. WYHC-5]|nr:hypothetical protein [Candidatus Magnetoovum sp. WYHC-5]
KKVVLKHENVRKVLGLDIDRATLETIFERLSFEHTHTNGTYEIIPPSFRHDICQEADIFEELARINGYDKIPSGMPTVKLSSLADESFFQKTATVKTWMRQAGFTEVINYSFMNPVALSTLSIATDDERAKCINIVNPLVNDYNLMRSFLLPSALEVFLHNIRHGITECHMYEVSKVFSKGNDVLPTERCNLIALSYDSGQNRLWSAPSGLFFQLKAVIEGLFYVCGVTHYEFVPSEEPFLADGQCADVRVGGVEEKLGYIGLLSPDVAATLELKVSKPEIAVFEICLDRVFSLKQTCAKYQELPKYPPVTLDMAIIIDADFPAFDIIKLIKGYPSDLIEEVEIFDSYQGKNIPEGKKNLAYRVTYRHSQRTLTDSEVDGLHKNIIKAIIERTGASLR